MLDITHTSITQYQFHINGERGIYEVAFSIDDDDIKSSCTCDYRSDKKLCWHRYYVLAGKTPRLQDGELLLQTELVQKLSKTSGGRELLRHAKSTFGEKETCRRCNKSKVLDLKGSLDGKIISMFVPKGRRYFCWSCRWSW
jgi:hypothetical protein